LLPCDDSILVGALEGPLEDFDDEVGANKANDHRQQSGDDTLDQHPPKIFEVLEKGFDGPALFLVVVFELGTFLFPG
jgi:hypothetical protein